jgi:thiamine pyrophosphokinase
VAEQPGRVERRLHGGVEVDVLVGDLDSVSPAALARAEASGVRIVRHPVAKDATDLELALDEALSLGARRALVVASAGGRMDHLLASLLLLASDRYTSVEVDALLGDALVHVVRGERTLGGQVGELLTLVPLGGPAVGVATSGLQYPLADETLQPGSTRGVSNVFSAPEARVSVRDGVLLAVRPHGAVT